MISQPNYSQDLTGKWILKELGYKEFKKNPGLQILKFDANKAELFTDLELTKPELNLSVSDNILLLDDGKKYGHYKLLEKNVLRLFANGTFNGDRAILDMDFLRLLPTKTQLSQKEIETLSFEYQEEGKPAFKIAFNQELLDKETLERLKWKEGTRMKIERLDETYFIAIFHHGRKGASMPIREVSTELLKIYCVPNKTGEIIAVRSK
ncbi:MULTISPECIES: hypothetical protein [Cellulophaga]|uniref:hypothetical protein n=1 Tax=Cellulophaga TaxID=104264 RepID=UPI0003FCD7D3|nr:MULTISPECIES: hypothetical protein [Cellulophaga]KGK31326.1 hypothetical protein EL45_06590 [Cellulophaga sp. E6(2014)]